MIDLPESKQLWAICSWFKVLPSDPRVKDLTAIQRLWLISNMNQDIEKQSAAAKGNGKQSFDVSADGTDPAAIAGLMRIAEHASTAR